MIWFGFGLVGYGLVLIVFRVRFVMVLGFGLSWFCHVFFVFCVGFFLCVPLPPSAPHPPSTRVRFLVSPDVFKFVRIAFRFKEGTVQTRVSSIAQK